MIPLLIVDDESIIRETIAAMVRRKYPEQFHIFLASNGQEALSLVASESVELVLADIKMPVMDGIEALKEIRRHTAELPVIMQTAYAFDTDRRTAEEAGCNGFITKPVMPRELKMYLDKYLK